MLKSYEAIYENGEFKWLSDQPDLNKARVIITVLPEQDISNREGNKKRRFPPDSIAGKGQTIGDIISPIVDEEDWECLK
ncbi:MAG: hypothetical protein EA414_05370 [Arthrospira sp. PLM2.Bin9]|nr:hypothetical protein [Arthrospira sp. PLM2.Bin9]TVU54721.1 MAG: hypothetical protein EA414_05370 [Arthrospira sp. PLM2.Bin9]